MFVAKLGAEFCKNIPDFSGLEPETRHDFLMGCLSAAKANGLLTEQGVASYALGKWWLGESFEEKSRYLRSLFMSNFPETRKVYAMNEWISAVIGEPENMASADEKLKQGFYRTGAWGSN